MQTDKHNEKLLPAGADPIYTQLLKSADKTIESLKKQRTWDKKAEVYNQFQQTLPRGQNLANLLAGLRSTGTKNYFLQFVAEDALKKKWFPKTKRVLNEEFYQLGTKVLNEEGIVVPYRYSYKKLKKMNQKGVRIQDFSSNYFRKYTWGLGCLSCGALRLNTPQSASDFGDSPFFHINSPLTITPDFANNNNLTILLLKNIEFSDDQDISELRKLTQLKYLYLLYAHFNLENAKEKFNSLLKQLEQLEQLEIKGFWPNSAFIPENLPPKLSSLTFESGPLINFSKAKYKDFKKQIELIPNYKVVLNYIDGDQVKSANLCHWAILGRNNKN